MLTLRGDIYKYVFVPELRSATERDLQADVVATDKAMKDFSLRANACTNHQIKGCYRFIP
jgi:hypothetical protein